MSGRQVIVAWLVFGLILMNLFFSGQWTQVTSQLTVKGPAAKGPPTSINVGGAKIPVHRKPVKKGNGTL